MRRFVAPTLLLLSVAACTDGPNSGQGARTPARMAQAIAPGGTISGTLLEQIPVGPYVYVRLETDGGELWAAVNEAKLTIGDSVTVYNVMLMEQFQSQSLKRTFARIYFGSLQPVNSAQGPSQSVPDGGASPMPGMPSPAMGDSPGTPAAVDAKVGTIAKATVVNARTIAELWSGKETLTGRNVSVRGVVVKYNPGVMGKNWIHLQDGTGSAASGTIDLTVTSLDEAALGDTITVSGVVRTNQDLGAGYTYALLLESAKVARR